MRILGNSDARSDEGIFLGYSSTKEAYRCYNFSLHNIVESVDVKVDDLKTKKFKHQKNILDSESEDDDELVGTQTDVEEKEDIQEDEIDTEEEEDDTQEEEEGSPRRDTKTPSRIVPKNHPEDQIIGNKSVGVQTRRQFIK